MRTSWRIRHHASRSIRSIERRWASDERRFAQSDYVILQPTRFKEASPVFLGPLTPGKFVETHKGKISHESIIGKGVRDVLHTTTASGQNTTRYRLHEVRLEDYVLHSRRLVTPIYPHDASLIVNLLDLHPEPHVSAQRASPQIEILEAGTGHGSLTLHLSRAIHAANGPIPRQSDDATEAEREEALRAWRESRQAVIHTIEVSAKHSKHASKIIRGFRRGQYYGNIDFHIGDVSEWIAKSLEDHAGRPFLTHAFLDLPGVQNHVATTAPALKTDGALMIFCPSITQINQCALSIRKDKIPLDLDRVVELGVNGGSGGRLWDIRLVKPRASLQRADVPEETGEEQDTASTKATEDTCTSASADERPTLDDDWQMICRPKVGERVTGGGFLAVFRKKSTDDTRDVLETEL